MIKEIMCVLIWLKWWPSVRNCCTYLHISFPIAQYLAVVHIYNILFMYTCRFLLLDLLTLWLKKKGQFLLRSPLVLGNDMLRSPSFCLFYDMNQMKSPFSNISIHLGVLNDIYILLLLLGIALIENSFLY